jgi:hypothetical protein
VALIAAGTTSTGGISALVMTRLRGKNNKHEQDEQREQGDKHGEE